MRTTLRGCSVGSQHLDSHFAVEFQVLGKVDRRHPTATEFALDSVAVGEGGFEAVEGVWHGAATPAGSTTKMGRAASDSQLAQASGFDGICCVSPLLQPPERRCTLGVIAKPLATVLHWRCPLPVISGHGVQNSQQLPGTRDERHLLRFPRRKQPFVERTQLRIPAPST